MMLKRIGTGLLALSLCAAGACKDADMNGELAEAASVTTDAAAAPAPTAFPESGYVAERVRLEPEIRRPEDPRACPVRLETTDGAADVVIESLVVNCCTDSIRPVLAVSGDTLTIRLHEYLDEPCECTTRMSVRFGLRGSDPVGRVLRVYVDGAPDPCFCGPPGA